MDFSRRLKAQPKEQYVKLFVAESLKTLSRTKSKLRKDFQSYKRKSMPWKEGEAIKEIKGRSRDLSQTLKILLVSKEMAEKK